MSETYSAEPPGDGFRNTGIKDRHRATLFRELIEIVKSHEELSKEVKLWIEGKNCPQDRTPYSVKVLPAVRFRPYTVGIQETAITRRRYLFGVYIDIYTPGLHFNDYLNLWDCIEESVVSTRPYKNTTVFNYLHGLLKCRGADSIVVQSDVCRDLIRNDQVIGRYGSGHIMIPFSKDA